MIVAPFKENLVTTCSPIMIIASSSHENYLAFSNSYRNWDIQLYHGPNPSLMWSVVIKLEIHTQVVFCAKLLNIVFQNYRPYVCTTGATQMYGGHPRPRISEFICCISRLQAPSFQHWRLNFSSGSYASIVTIRMTGRDDDQRASSCTTAIGGISPD